MEIVDITTIRFNESNPRTITDTQLQKLKKSLKDFPEMLTARPLVVDENNIVIGGNMRLKALLELGYKEIPVKKIDNFTEQQKKEFIIKDNVGYGEWDWEILNNEWDLTELSDWGLEPLEFDKPKEERENLYTKKVQAPIYLPSEDKPTLTDTYDDSKFKVLVKQIEDSTIDPEMKDYLKLCAVRHIVFNYTKIADLYANSDTEVQELMENAALVIIDYDKAIELGYVNLGDKLMEQFNSEYPDDEE